MIDGRAAAAADALLFDDVVVATGAGMGFVFGLFLGAMGDMQPLQMINGREVPQAPFREQVRTPTFACKPSCGRKSWVGCSHSKRMHTCGLHVVPHSCMRAQFYPAPPIPRLTNLRCWLLAARVWCCLCQARLAYKQTAERSLSMGRNFASFSGAYGCVRRYPLPFTDTTTCMYTGTKDDAFVVSR